ncbi:hypothetical protein BDR05DRAFT_947347 [Suillus weaverae]|nr:hypothetical protein BDR05DRAFT_947347 [Suillus weaverae]
MCFNACAVRATSSREQGMVEINDELSEGWQDLDWGKEKVSRWIDAPGRVTSRVVGTRDVASEEGTVQSCSEVMDLLENCVGGLVSAPTFPPAFNDTTVVTKYFDVAAFCALSKEHDDEKFHPNCLCPTNVSIINFPTWEEMPGMPSAIDPYCDASA